MTNRESYARWICRGIGLLLLCAAALKAHGMGTGPVARMGVFSGPEFQLAMILFELFLGLWLLSGKQPTGSWLAAMAMFAAFATVSFYQGAVGQSSCGCFGSLEVSPWYVFGLDVLILGALTFARPDLRAICHEPLANLRSAAIRGMQALAGLLAIAALLIGLAHLGFGSLPAAIAYFRGERVSIAPRLVDVGTGKRGQTITGAITLTNWTDKPIRVIGGTSDCSCIATEDLPITLPPRQPRELSVHLRLPVKPGMLTRTGFSLTDDGMRAVRFRVTARVEGNP